MQKTHGTLIEMLDADQAQTLGKAMQEGYWRQIASDKVVAKFLQCPVITADMGATIAKTAQRVMSEEKPQGIPWEGWGQTSGVEVIPGAPPANWK